MNQPNSNVLVSACCRDGYHEVPKVTKKTAPGVTCYFYACCDKCGKLCDTITSRIFDSAGIEIKHGDLVEVPELPDDHAERWHAAYESGCGLDIRDIGYNNTGMYSCYERYFSRGPYWKHLDKVTDEDLQYYWETTRDEALKSLEADEAQNR